MFLSGIKQLTTWQYTVGS